MSFPVLFQLTDRVEHGLARLYLAPYHPVISVSYHVFPQVGYLSERSVTSGAQVRSQTSMCLRMLLQMIRAGKCRFAFLARKGSLPCMCQTVLLQMAP